MENRIKKTYKYSEFTKTLQNNQANLVDEIVELFDDESEFIELRLRTDDGVVFILHVEKNEEKKVTLFVDRVKHASIKMSSMDGEFELNSEFLKALQEHEVDARIKVMEESESENAW
ncbi:MAG: hypothetical protein U9N42_03055 [Campylobacterota bacterium]|nr:hypothetical protein [Campylobacterota bacterium]